MIGGRAIGVSSALSLKTLGILDVMICEPNEIRENYLTEKCRLQMIHPDELDVNSHFDVGIDGAGFESSRELASAKVQPGGAIVQIGLGPPGEDRILGESLSKISPLLAVTHARIKTSERPLKLCLMVD